MYKISLLNYYIFTCSMQMLTICMNLQPHTCSMCQDCISCNGL